MAKFSKKSLTPAPASAKPAASGALGHVRAAIANPYISASGAALLFLLTLTALVMIIGDPKAGAPVIRLPLAQAVVAAAPQAGARRSPPTALVLGSSKRCSSCRRRRSRRARLWAAKR